MIKITKCSDNLLWYRNKIGQAVELVREDSQYYWSREDGKLPIGGHLNIIHKCDAYIIDSSYEVEDNIVLGYD